MELPQGWFSENNINTYRKLVSKIPNNGSMIEIGVWKGRSLCSVSDIIKSKNITVYAIDTFLGTESELQSTHQEAKYKTIKEQFIYNISSFGILENVKVFELTSEEFSKFHLPADLVFIDGDHSYKSIKSDIKNYFPFALKIIAGHDYDTNWSGVIKAVGEFFTKFEIEHDIWIVEK
jgi:hypothetical protein